MMCILQYETFTLNDTFFINFFIAVNESNFNFLLQAVLSILNLQFFFFLFTNSINLDVAITFCL